MPANYRTMQELAHDSLREGILTGRYVPGQRLMLEELAQELGTSHMPIREALKRLEAAGLVRIVPHRGAIVTELSKREIAEIYQMRAVLEGLAIRRAAPKISPTDFERLHSTIECMHQAMSGSDLGKAQEANENFHAIIWEAADAPRLKETLKNLNDASQRFRSVSMTTPGRLAEIIQEHQAIVRALCDKDVAAAERCAIQHYENTAQRLLAEVDRARASVSS